MKTKTTNPAKKRSRNGKVARLAYDYRNFINLAIRNGFPFAAIIKMLGPAGAHLTPDNIGNWKGGGYQDWLKEQFWLEEMKAKLEFARDVLRDNDASKIHEASLCIAVKQMYDFLADFNPSSCLEKMGDDLNTYARILNSLAKLTEAALRYERQRGEDARGNAKRSKNLNADGTLGLTPEIRKTLEDEMNLMGSDPNQPNPTKVNPA